MAAEQSKSLHYWFRQKYNLPPTDERFISMTDEDIALEYEIWLASEGKLLKTCYKCKATTHRDVCPGCGIAISGDELADDVYARIEAGEDVDLNSVFGKNEEWEEVVID